MIDEDFVYHTTTIELTSLTESTFRFNAYEIHLARCLATIIRPDGNEQPVISSVIRILIKYEGFFVMDMFSSQ